MTGKGIQTQNGKAFEYACVKAFYNAFSCDQKVVIQCSEPMQTAKELYESCEEKLVSSLDSAALASVRIIKRLEPQLWFPNGNEPLLLSIQADSAGIKGDVRDVLCIRSQNGWQIGLSCKHNHHAVKHSRLSNSIDFGKEWFGVPCSEKYFEAVNPIFNELKELKDKGKETGEVISWNSLNNKAERFYIPVLNAFMDELKRIDISNAGIPEKLIRYLLGKNDFYKVITDDANKTTRVEAINISGTLNRPSGNMKSIAKVGKLKMPSTFYHVGYKSGSNNTIELILDEGWQISMRIHSASTAVEPSLKFDVNLISFPTSVYSESEPWNINYLNELQRPIKEQAAEE